MVSGFASPGLRTRAASPTPPERSPTSSSRPSPIQTAMRCVACPEPAGRAGGARSQTSARASASSAASRSRRTGRTGHAPASHPIRSAQSPPHPRARRRFVSPSLPSLAVGYIAAKQTPNVVDDRRDSLVSGESRVGRALDVACRLSPHPRSEHAVVAEPGRRSVSCRRRDPRRW
jgi:hypothetical protein